jgi:hypothetical protein
VDLYFDTSARTFLHKVNSSFQLPRL